MDLYTSEGSSRDRTIAEHSLLCRSLLCSAFSRAEGHSFNLLEEQLARFNLWTSHFGVFAGTNSSLDHRLQEAPAIKKGVCDLLVVLRVILGRLDQVWPVEQESSNDAVSVNFNDSDASTARSRSPTHLTASIEEIMERVKDVISRIQGLSLAIRRAGPRNSFSKVAVFPIRDREGNDVSNVFTHFVNEFLKFRIRSDISDVLRARIREAICFRRRRFDYTWHHSSRLWATKSEVDVVSSPAQGNLLDEDTQHTGKISRPGTTVSSHKSVGRRSPSPGISSSQRSKPRYDEENLPPPPEVSADVNVFKCPYCCLDYPADEFRERHRWLHHIEEDLEPYVCISDLCSKSNEMFASAKAWLDHTNEEHSMEWLCSLPGCGPATTIPMVDAADHVNDMPITFCCEAEYICHLQDCHSDTLSLFQMSVLARKNKRPVDILTSCPFCGFAPANVSLAGMPAHIARHLCSLASLSLPIRYGASEVGSDQAIQSRCLTTEPLPSGRYSVASVQLDFTDTGSSQDINPDLRVLDAASETIKATWHDVNHFHRNQISPRSNIHPNLQFQLPKLLVWLFGSADPRCGDQSAIDELARAGGVNDPNDWTLSREVIDKALTSCIRFLLENETPNLDLRDADKLRIPLSHAAEQGYAGVVGVVVATGIVSLDYTDLKGRTPLGHAASEGHLATAKHLLDAKADPDFRGVDGQGPTYLASSRGHAPVVQVLLEHGANPGLPAANGKTPLHGAAISGDIAVTNLLLSYGASLIAQDALFETPLTIAIRQRSHVLVDLMIKSGRMLRIDNPSLIMASRLGESSEISQTIQQWIGRSVDLQAVVTHESFTDRKDWNAEDLVRMSNSRGYKSTRPVVFDRPWAFTSSALIPSSTQRTAIARTGEAQQRPSLDSPIAEFVLNTVTKAWTGRSGAPDTRKQIANMPPKSYTRSLMASPDLDSASEGSVSGIDSPGKPSKRLSGTPTTFQEMLANGFHAKSKSSFASTMSLPRFRKEHPKLFWPVKGADAMVEIKPGQNLEDPHRFGIEYLDGVVGSSGSKTMVIKGKVWKENRQKEVLAVKVILYRDPAAKEKAMNELRILQKINHPHIIAAIGSCSTVVNKETRLGVLLSPLAPKNLEQHLQEISSHNSLRLEDPRLPVHQDISRLLSFYACLCQTVLHLHAQMSPIKHRDIKPSNILIDTEGTVILADFDIARQYDDKTKAITIRGVEYTVKYAPTHVVRQSPTGLEWDVNCLGFVFLEMATIILGKTMEDLLLYLQFHEVSKAESVARTTDTNETAEMTEVRFSDALDIGTIDGWMKELQRHADKNPGSMPVEFRTSDRKSPVADFLRAISKMMKAQENDYDVLESAWDIFSSLTDHCEHCCPPSGAGMF